MSTEVRLLDKEVKRNATRPLMSHLAALLRTVNGYQKALACGDGAARSELRLAERLRTQLRRLHARVRKATGHWPASRGPTVRLLPLGDSITDGGSKLRSYRYHMHRLAAHGPHPRRIAWIGTMAGVYDRQQGSNATRGLVQVGPQHADWPRGVQAHEGHWGWTSRQVLHGHERQPQRGSLNGWLKRLVGSGVGPPDVALVHLGTNDLTKHVLKEGRGAQHERVSAVTRRMHLVVQRLCQANPRMHILLAAPPIPYCRFKASTGSGAVDVKRREVQRLHRRAAEEEYARQLHGLCAARDHSNVRAREGGWLCRPEHVACVNMSDAVGCEHLGPDGVHPAATGARRMAAAWWRVLEPRLNAIVAEASTAAAALGRARLPLQTRGEREPVKHRDYVERRSRARHPSPRPHNATRFRGQGAATGTSGTGREAAKISRGA